MLEIYKLPSNLYVMPGDTINLRIKGTLVCSKVITGQIGKVKCTQYGYFELEGVCGYVLGDGTLAAWFKKHMGLEETK